MLPTAVVLSVADGVSETELSKGSDVDTGSKEEGDAVLMLPAVSAEAAAPEALVPLNGKGDEVAELPLVSVNADVLEIPTEEGGNVLLGILLLSAEATVSAALVPTKEEGDDVVAGLLVVPAAPVPSREDVDEDDVVVAFVVTSAKEISGGFC